MMRLTKKILLGALLPTLALALALMFAPTAPPERGSDTAAHAEASVEIATLAPITHDAPNLLAYAWNQARDLWAATWGRAAAAA